MTDTSICVVAGEPSGDLHGSHLIAALRRENPNWRFWGLGSDKMEAAGCELWQNARTWAAVGLTEVFKSVGKFRRRLRKLTEEIARRCPDAVILIDYPGFNLRLASHIKKLGIPVLYFIAPQLWAWGAGRIRVFQNHVDHTVVVFPFEETYFRARGVNVSWVGHPLVDVVRPSAMREVLRQRFGVGPYHKLVTMLPGSRASEFASHLPRFTEAVRLVSESVPDTCAALGLAPALSELAAQFTNRATPLIVSSEVYDLMAASDLVITKPGTATIECALLNVPMVTAYKTDALTYTIARHLTSIDQMAMPNLLLKRTVVPEHIQSDATPNKIADSAIRLLTDSGVQTSQLQALAEVRISLGEPGAIDRIGRLMAEWIAALN